MSVPCPRDTPRRAAACTSCRGHRLHAHRCRRRRWQGRLLRRRRRCRAHSRGRPRAARRARLARLIRQQPQMSNDIAPKSSAPRLPRRCLTSPCRIRSSTPFAPSAVVAAAWLIKLQYKLVRVQNACQETPRAQNSSTSRCPHHALSICALPERGKLPSSMRSPVPCLCARGGGDGSRPSRTRCRRWSSSTSARVMPGRYSCSGQSAHSESLILVNEQALPPLFVVHIRTCHAGAGAPAAPGAWISGIKQPTHSTTDCSHMLHAWAPYPVTTSTSQR